MLNIDITNFNNSILNNKYNKINNIDIINQILTIYKNKLSEYDNNTISEYDNNTIKLVNDNIIKVHKNLNIIIFEIKNKLFIVQNNMDEEYDINIPILYFLNILGDLILEIYQIKN